MIEREYSWKSEFKFATMAYTVLCNWDKLKLFQVIGTKYTPDRYNFMRFIICISNQHLR